MSRTKNNEQGAKSNEEFHTERTVDTEDTEGKALTLAFACGEWYDSLRQ